jgi:hypothetical protein
MRPTQMMLRRDVRLWHKADVRAALTDVCFRGNSGHRSRQRQSKLLVEQRNVLGWLWFGPRLQVGVDVGEI